MSEDYLLLEHDRAVAVSKALAMLATFTNLTPASLAAIKSAIETGQPLYCIANKEAAGVLTVLSAGEPYKQPPQEKPSHDRTLSDENPQGIGDFEGDV